MSAQAIEPDEPYEKVPASRLRRLEAIERHAPADVIAEAEAEEAEIEADIAAHRAYVAAGRPGAERHEDVKRELLAELGL